MGLLFSSLFSKLFGSQEVRVLILGLDNAGKTTILFKLYAPNRVIRTMPTIGFNVETVVYKNINFNVWDLGGQTNIRPYWRCYYEKTNAIIFVVDSCDKERMSIAKKELLSMMEEEELKGAILLVFANKQDGKGAMSEADVSLSLGLHTIKDRQYHIQKSSATKGEGLQEGLEWMANAIQTQIGGTTGSGGTATGGISSWFGFLSSSSSTSSTSSSSSSTATSSSSSSPTPSSSSSSSSTN